ncbi:sortase [candidate division WWE3 bacterium]|uniref:Sortase n=1 Tax=candidate division WWE3 bacterium TaxID=2053526 RepID=A0A7X9DKV0_UNCKA|nr:sortase [candidate division WWE3 bacterium]
MVKLSKILIKMGLFLIAISVVMYLVFFYPIIIQEVKYFVLPHKDKIQVLTSENAQKDKTPGPSQMIPADEEFSIIIPKIGANSKVISNVNPYDPNVYQKALTKGVAHAEGTVFPGQVGNTFLFSHSSTDFYQADRYNAVFYLLNKLSTGDTFYLVYQKNVYRYIVERTNIVNSSEIEYLDGSAEQINSSTATLMTCWPAGTSLKRFVVVGRLVADK